MTGLGRHLSVDPSVTVGEVRALLNSSVEIRTDEITEVRFDGEQFVEERRLPVRILSDLDDAVQLGEVSDRVASSGSRPPGRGFGRFNLFRSWRPGDGRLAGNEPSLLVNRCRALVSGSRCGYLNVLSQYSPGTECQNPSLLGHTLVPSSD